MLHPKPLRPFALESLYLARLSEDWSTVAEEFQKRVEVFARDVIRHQGPLIRRGRYGRGRRGVQDGITFHCNSRHILRAEWSYRRFAPKPSDNLERSFRAHPNAGLLYSRTLIERPH